MQSVFISKDGITTSVWIALAFLVVTLLAWPTIGTPTADASAYIDIAKGSPAVQPFASRAAIPKLANLLSSATGVALEVAFLGIKTVTLALFLWCVSRIARLYGADERVVLWLAACAPVVSRVYGLSFLPDFEFMTLVAATVLAASSGHVLALLLGATGMTAVREFGLVIGLALAVSAATSRNLRMAAAALGGTATGAAVAWLLAAESPGNVHGMPGLAYFVLKLPVNAISNWLGIRFFSSGVLTCEHRAFELPSWVTAGFRFPGIVGVCWPDPAWILRTVVLSLSTMGILPGMVVARLLVHRGGAEERVTKMVLVGGAVWFLGTISGTWVDKLVAPALPFALVLVAASLPRRLGIDIVPLLGLHVAAGLGTLWLWEAVFGPASLLGGVLASACWTICQTAAYAMTRGVLVAKT